MATLDPDSIRRLAAALAGDLARFEREAWRLALAGDPAASAPDPGTGAPEASEDPEAPDASATSVPRPVLPHPADLGLVRLIRRLIRIAETTSAELRRIADRHRSARGRLAALRVLRQRLADEVQAAHAARAALREAGVDLAQRLERDAASLRRVRDGLEQRGEPGPHGTPRPAPSNRRPAR